MLGDPTRPWDIGERDPLPVTAVEAMDPAVLLAESWHECFVHDGGVDPAMAPSGPVFPGL